MNLPNWRTFCAREPVLANRRQSLAFLRGESLHPVALRPTSKLLDAGAKRVIADWVHTDAFVGDNSNWGAVLRPPFLDIDIDILPLRGVRDQAFVDEAMAVIESVESAFKAAGVQFRGFGRASFGFKGHLIVPCLCTKEEAKLLANLHMAKGVRSGNVVVRIEVRRPSEVKGSPKNFTLPGSVYLDGDKLDLIGWSVLSEWKEGEEIPALTPQPFGKLKLALYAALMALAVVPHWEQGARHAMANLTAGALAREHMAGGLTEDDCAFVMEHVIAEAVDDEPEDRLRCLTDSIQGLMHGRHVTGYTALAEVIGNDWKAALLRLRGGGDPDAIGRLFEIVARVREGQAKQNCYIDLSLGADLYSELDQYHVRQRFSARDKEFPAVVNAAGKKVPAIEIVLHSSSLRTFDQAVSFPGIDFGSTFYWDGETAEWESITEETPAPVGAKTAINVAPGFATPPLTEGQKPDRRDWAIAKHHWFTLRDHITDGDPAQIAKLEQIIARKLQHPRAKDAVGVALVGGEGIGKTALFEVMLAPIIGRGLIAKATTTDLQSQYRFDRIERVLFYYVDECRFDRLNDEAKQLLKDIMRNPTAFRNSKYGKIGEVPNRAVPFFPSNDLNPKLMFDGRADRALVVIRGEHQASMGMTQAQWTDHRKLVDGEVKAFIEALRRFEVRQALLHYFLTLPINPDVLLGDELAATSEDLQSGLPAPLAALLEMFETGYIMPERRGDRGPTITDPFTLETLAAGLRERLRNRGVSTFVTSNAGVGLLVSELFMENTRERGVRRSKGIDREQREGKVLRAARHYHNGEAKRMYYFGFQRGRLLNILEQQRGIKIDPEFELNGDEMSVTQPPTKEAMQKALAFATELSQMAMFRGLGYA